MAFAAFSLDTRNDCPTLKRSMSAVPMPYGAASGTLERIRPRRPINGELGMRFRETGGQL